MSAPAQQHGQCTVVLRIACGPGEAWYLHCHLPGGHQGLHEALHPDGRCVGWSEFGGAPMVVDLFTPSWDRGPAMPEPKHG